MVLRLTIGARTATIGLLRPARPTALTACASTARASAQGRTTSASTPGGLFAVWYRLARSGSG